ncbi:hypothetical protein [Pseudomonas fluorescens]|nr:hypothetical protein [Pseudomonas fluorescens]
MYGLGLFLLLAAGQAGAQDLPNLSLLTRYGVTEEQLPAAPAELALTSEPTKSHFEIQPERPLIRLEKNGGLVSETTGNISIDNATAQDQVRCARAQAELTRRGTQNSLACEDRAKVSTTVWSRE